MIKGPVTLRDIVTMLFAFFANVVVVTALCCFIAMDYQWLFRTSDNGIEVLGRALILILSIGMTGFEGFAYFEGRY